MEMGERAYIDCAGARWDAARVLQAPRHAGSNELAGFATRSRDRTAQAKAARLGSTSPDDAIRTG